MNPPTDCHPHHPVLPTGYGPAVSEKCPETGSNFTMGGPFWSQPLHDQEWVAGLLEQIRADKAK